MRPSASSSTLTRSAQRQRRRRALFRLTGWKRTCVPPEESGNVDGSSVIVSSTRTTRPSTRWHRRMHHRRQPSIVKRSRVWALRREIIQKCGRAGRAMLGWFRSLDFEVRLPNRALLPPRITEGLARSGVDGVRDVHLDRGHAAGQARRCGPARWVRRRVRPRRAPNPATRSPKP